MTRLGVQPILESLDLAWMSQSFDAQMFPFRWEHFLLSCCTCFFFPIVTCLAWVEEKITWGQMFLSVPFYSQEDLQPSTHFLGGENRSRSHLDVGPPTATVSYKRSCQFFANLWNSSLSSHAWRLHVPAGAWCRQVSPLPARFGRPYRARPALLGDAR